MELASFTKVAMDNSMNEIPLEQLLESLTEFWRTNNFPLLSKLAPGIDSNKIEPRNFTGVTPEDLKVLYKWRNGLKPEFATELIGRVTMFSGGVPMNIGKVWRAQDIRGGKEVGWGMSYLAIFESGGGDFFLVDCDPNSPEFGQIIYYSPGSVDFDLTIGYYDSLITLFQTTYECYKRGIYTIDDQMFLRVDFAEEAKVAYDLNPKSRYWGLFK
jgi:hypothetical protein